MTNVTVAARCRDSAPAYTKWVMRTRIRCHKLGVSIELTIRREQAMYKQSKKPSSHSRTAHRCAIRLVVPLCFAVLGPVAAQAATVTSTCTAATNGSPGNPGTDGGAGGDGTV